MKLSDVKQVAELNSERCRLLEIIRLVRSPSDGHFGVSLWGQMQTVGPMRTAAGAGIEAYVREKVSEIDEQLVALGVDVAG